MEVLDEHLGKEEKKKIQNRLRQAKHYALKKEEINAKRRERYRACVEKCLKEANKGYNEPLVPEKPVFTKGDLKIKDLSKNKTLSYDEIVKYLDELGLNVNTAIKYKQDIKRFVKITDCDDIIKCLKRSNIIISDIENGKMNNGNPYSNNTKKGLYQTILFIVDRFNLKINKQPYKLKFEETKLQSMEDNDRSVYDKPVMKFSQFIDRVKQEFGENSKMYAIVKLYDDVPMRDDFQLKIVDKITDTKDKQFNYIVMYAGKPSKVIMNNYKTKNLYGTIQVNVSKATSKLLRNYVKNNNLNMGDYLFGSDKLSSYITSFNNKLGVEKGFSTYRHMKISEELSKVKSIPERQQLASVMGHSPVTQLKYVRNLINE
jgi:hypothetical protein